MEKGQLKWDVRNVYKPTSGFTIGLTLGIGYKLYYSYSNSKAVST